MHIEIVDTEQKKKLFHRLPHRIYRYDRNWIAPLKQDVERIFSEKNPWLQEHIAERYLLLDGVQILGRMAISARKEQDENALLRVGRMGYYECADDPEAAALLLQKAEYRLQELGCNAMDAPVNFGSRDRWWGLLTEGFVPPVYGLQYARPYYKKQFIDFGFQTYFEQYTYTLHDEIGLPNIVYAVRDRLVQRGNIRFASADPKHLEKSAADFLYIYNKAWVQHDDFHPLSMDDCMALLKEVKPILDPDLFLFAYADKEPVGFFLGLPDANQLLRYAKGDLNGPGMLRVLLRKPFTPMPNVYGIIFGVIPEYQLKGIESGLAAFMHDAIRKSRKYKQIELLWIGDFNKKMLNFVEHIQAKKLRTLITYRKIFDASIPFERCPYVE